MARDALELAVPPEVVDGFDKGVHHPTPEEQRGNRDKNQKRDESDVIILSHASFKLSRPSEPAVAERVSFETLARANKFSRFSGS